MGLIRLQNATKQFGGQVVLDNVSLDLHTNEIAALVGANGVGKTTLCRLITGQVTPDVGTVTLSKGLAVGYLPQEPDVAADLPLRAAVAEAFADLVRLEQKLQDLAQQMSVEHAGPELQTHMQQYDRLCARFETAGGYRFEQRLDEVLGGLGFLPADYDLPVSVLSGGQKCRAALAKLLLQERRFLLLDEPTNHLDIDAVRWLEKFLAGHHGGALIISHDRYLLDRLAQRTIEVVAAAGGGRVRSYVGNYTRSVETRAQRRLTQQREYEKDRAFLEREQAFIAKHIAGQRTKEAQGRRKRLQRRLDAGEFTLDQPGGQRTASFGFRSSGSGGPAKRKAATAKEIVRVEELRKQYGDKPLFADLSLSVYAGQRLGITGPNGTGKTTLLRIVLGQLDPDTGSARVSPTARVGYFAQEPEDLDPDKTVIEEIVAVRPDFLERDARNYAARFLFGGEDPFKRVGQLSGGEQSRVRFMKLILSAPDLLVLDEPTNHLDIPSREALEAALAEFPGTVITVSHDRYFLDRTVEKLLVMRADDVRFYHGNYSYYIEQIEQQRAAQEAAAAVEKGGARRRGAAGRKPAAKESSAQKSPYAKMKLDELEAFISEREERIAVLNERFGDPEVYRNPETIMQLRAEFELLNAELTAAEQAWLDRAERE